MRVGRLFFRQPAIQYAGAFRKVKRSESTRPGKLANGVAIFVPLSSWCIDALAFARTITGSVTSCTYL
jgi:hypothetical protein